MNEKLRIVAYVAVALAVAYGYGWCSYRRGASDALVRAADVRTDAVADSLRRVVKDTMLVFNRHRDSTSRVIRDLKARVGVAGRTGGRREPDSSATPPSAPDVRDTLIAALEAGRRADSLEIVFWRAQTYARDTLITQLQASRDVWRKQAQRPDHWVTDIGGSALATYGILKENEIAVAAGGATILLPRLYGAVARIF